MCKGPKGEMAEGGTKGVIEGLREGDKTILEIMRSLASTQCEVNSEVPSRHRQDLPWDGTKGDVRMLNPKR